MVKDPVITPAHVRSARGWLNWSKNDLSERSGISERTIARYEHGRSVPYVETLASLRASFEAAGICFQFDGMSGKGISVR
jgi:transcriptional regulator with XRE-family HTH domain